MYVYAVIIKVPTIHINMLHYIYTCIKTHTLQRQFIGIDLYT